MPRTLIASLLLTLLWGAAACTAGSVQGGDDLGDSDDRPPPFGVTLTVEPLVWGLTNDRDPSVSGVQIRALVETDNVRDGTLYLCSDRRPTDGAPCPQDGFVITSVDHTAVLVALDAVSMEDGVHQLHVEILDELGALSVSEEAWATVDSVPPRVTRFWVAEDTDQDLIVTAAELGHADPTLALEVDGANGRPLEIFTEDGLGVSLGTTTVLAGVANLEVALARGSHDLLARVTSSTDNPNISTAPLIENPEAHLTVEINRCGNGFCDAGEDALSCDFDCGNLLANPSFEESATEPAQWSTFGNGLLAITTDGYDGAHALELENDGTGNLGLSQLEVRNPPTTTPFRFSYWVRPIVMSAGAVVAMEVQVRYTDTTLEYVRLAADPLDIGSWVVESVDFVPAKPVNQLRIYLIAYDSTAVAQFDAVSVLPLPPE